MERWFTFAFGHRVLFPTLSLLLLTTLSSSHRSPPLTLCHPGMAGSGKTSLLQRLAAHLHAKKTPPYLVNLDPAVHSTPFEANIDVRDTINYKEVMRQYGLGPNGGIVTSLNLFATRFDQVSFFIGSVCVSRSLFLVI